MCILVVNDVLFILLLIFNIYNEVIYFNSMKYVNIFFFNILLV